jgi:hypothetical protein
MEVIMPVNSTCYRLGQGNNWTNGKVGVSANTRGHNTHNHAERAAYRAHNQGTVFLIVQNAFPCPDCHTYFTNQTGYSVIIRVTDDHGGYSADHPAGHRTTPKTIYYRNGAATYGAAPVGFPAHANVATYG